MAEMARSKGQGTIVPTTDLPDGRKRWRVAVTMADGRRVWRTAHSPREAERIRQQLVEARELDLAPTLAHSSSTTTPQSGLPLDAHE